MINKIDDDRIQTAQVWSRKQPLHQPRRTNGLRFCYAVQAMLTYAGTGSSAAQFN